MRSDSQPNGEGDLPLTGLRVVDLTTSYAGPTATMLLADMGADVIKVESPGGDDTRKWGPPFLGGGESAWFLSANRNKRSVSLDLRGSEGADQLTELLREADVLVTSLSPTKLASIGLDPDVITERFPRLVYCVISGFGLDGPDAALPGYDLIAQARSGLMSVTGESEDSPQRVSTALSDSVAGLVAAYAVTAACHRQQRTGRGEVIDVSLLESALMLMAPRIAAFLAGGEEPVPCGATDSVLTPYQRFATADRPIVVAAGNDAMWRRLCEAIGDEDLLADPRFATTALRQEARPDVIDAVATRLATRPSAHWLELFAERRVPAALVHRTSEVVDDPHLVWRKAMQTAEHPEAGPFTVVGPPWRLRSSPARDIRIPPPGLGQHTDEVLGTNGSPDRPAGHPVDK